jgi:hypothetical protein
VKEGVALGMEARRLLHAVEGEEEVQELGVHSPWVAATPTRASPRIEMKPSGRVTRAGSLRSA